LKRLDGIGITGGVLYCNSVKNIAGLTARKKYFFIDDNGFDVGLIIGLVKGMYWFIKVSIGSRR
jgi:hypothetical protein